MANNNKFLGRGLKYPLRLGADGGFARDVETSSIIASSIGVILGTRIGERIWNPEFGSNLYSLKHEPNTKITWNFVKEDVFRAIERWEPRIDRLRIDVNPSSRADSTGRFLLEIVISYVIISENRTENLVYPFFLER